MSHYRLRRAYHHTSGCQSVGIHWHCYVLIMYNNNMLILVISNIQLAYITNSKALLKSMCLIWWGVFASTRPSQSPTARPPAASPEAEDRQSTSWAWTQGARVPSLAASPPCRWGQLVFLSGESDDECEVYRAVLSLTPWAKYLVANTLPWIRNEPTRKWSKFSSVVWPRISWRNGVSIIAGRWVETCVVLPDPWVLCWMETII